MTLNASGPSSGLLLALLLATMPATASADDGYELWLDYRALAPAAAAALRPRASGIVTPGVSSDTMRLAIDELQRGLGGLLTTDIALTDALTDGSIVVGTPASSAAIREMELPLAALGAEGFVLRSGRFEGREVTVVAANRDIGVLYGSFALLRWLQTGGSLDGLDETSAPRIQRRVLNHWDNLDRSVERGYAGQSIWDWWRLPDYLDPRYHDYARANASIGINGAVLNNVNATSESLSARYIGKAAALANVFRPFGLRVYLSARFTAPMELGGLDTADPLDPAVRDWWAAKAAEIYAAIPDFGGFLVKANSEGQPGPQDYGRSHADGANMLAAALDARGGIVMWRAFVYADDNPEDRAKQAYSEFRPLDGKFAKNVILQVKNGPIDFQPREPFHPLFGAMPDTPLMAEFQITKEYLGFATHLVYLGTLFEEVLRADTFAAGAGSTVARVIDGSVHGYGITGIAGVANIGVARDWSGSLFDQANWYAFGRLAWNPDLSARGIAGEWLRMTVSVDDEFVQSAATMMMGSHQAAVDYMTPLGLAHLMGTGHHYGPAPWVADLARPEWNPVYYHRADAQGIGFDRTPTGSNAVAQYGRRLARQFADIDQVPEHYLLWFHHVDWQHRMESGKTLWEEVVARYDRGVAAVETMNTTWQSFEGHVDAERFAQTRTFLAVQQREAQWWRDACIAYFQRVSGLELPAGTRAPAQSLEYYQSLRFPFAPGN